MVSNAAFDAWPEVLELSDLTPPRAPQRTDKPVLLCSDFNDIKHSVYIVCDRVAINLLPFTRVNNISHFHLVSKNTEVVSRKEGKNKYTDEWVDRSEIFVKCEGSVISRSQSVRKIKRDSDRNDSKKLVSIESDKVKLWIKDREVSNLWNIKCDITEVSITKGVEIKRQLETGHLKCEKVELVLKWSSGKDLKHLKVQGVEEFDKSQSEQRPINTVTIFTHLTEHKVKVGFINS